MTGRQHLLMIAYKFPPMQSVSCHRTWAVYNGMQKYFPHVSVISTTNRHKLLQDAVDTSAADVTDAWTCDYRTILQGRRRPASASERTKESVIGRFALKLQSSFPTMLLFGEGNAIYIRNAVRIGSRMVREKKITHLFSTFSPYADHLIAAKLKEMFPELIWIADFRDLHVDPTQSNLFWTPHQIAMNEKILRSADIVTTVSEGLAAHLKELHPRVCVLTNGIRELTQPDAGLFPRFTITYTGSMFQDKRRPHALLSAVRTLADEGVVSPDNFQIIYAGKDSAVWQSLAAEFAIAPLLLDKGLISQAEAETLQRRSHFNLLLTYSAKHMQGNLTGKLFDYLSAQRPVLVLIHGPSDKEMENLINKTNAGSVFYDGDVLAIRNYLLQAMEKWKNTGDLPHAYHQAALKEYSWERILDDFMKTQLFTEPAMYA